ncbi:MAG: putative bifunctional diguanylate cyclase/phosphodiesterase [Steroidobacteraceae bacterium]
MQHKAIRPVAGITPDTASRWISMVASVTGYGVTISNAERRLVWVNDSFTRMTGYNLAEVLDKKTSDLLYFEGSSIQTINRAREAFASTRGIRFELLVRGKHSREWWLDTDAQPLFNERGTLQGWVCVQADVTAAVRRREAARAEERKFATLLDAAPEAIIGVSDDGAIRFTNARVPELFGYTAAELDGAQIELLIPQRFHAGHTAARSKFIERPRMRPMGSDTALFARRKDGAELPVEISLSRIEMDCEGVVLCIVRDVSEQKLAETQRKAMQSELAKVAWEDNLTGLANRALFMESLQKALDRVRCGDQPLFAVLFLDFDRFKLINDTLGHKAGDELLRQIAGRLQGALRTADIICEEITSNLVARFGGDEFLILINNLQAPDDASRIAERLLNTLAPVYDIFGSEVQSTASIGIVTSEQCQANVEEIVRNADVAMYEAKRAGRACSVVFNEAMHVRLTRHAMIETSLRRAIGTPELFLVYQPIVELHSGQMVSVEALARWNHPALGAISPSEFIPIAEESGLIVTVGEWVLRQACQAMLTWLRQDPLRAPKTMSINVSRAELALGPRLIQQLRDTLSEVGLPAERLQLEVTEREVMRNPAASLETLHALRRFGFKLAMDDFGTGTSSLSCLREYPFDTIKIDRSFLKDLTTNRDVLAVIHATISLVGNLGMGSVAEGVEEPSQVAVLQSLGCHYAQGYLFSRPVTAEQLLDALEPHSKMRLALS